MNPKSALAILCLAAAPCGAQTAAEAPPAPAAAASSPARAPLDESAPEPGEPNVRHIVVEDSGSRIDELRVRGTTQRVVVTPKLPGSKSYEIIMGDGSRNLTDGANTSRGAAGKRVWNVLAF